MRECPLKVYLSSTHSKGTSAEALTMWTVTELCPYFLFSAFHGAVGFLGILWNSYTRSHTTALRFPRNVGGRFSAGLNAAVLGR